MALRETDDVYVKDVLRCSVALRASVRNDKRSNDSDTSSLEHRECDMKRWRFATLSILWHRNAIEIHLSQTSVIALLKQRW